MVCHCVTECYHQGMGSMALLSQLYHGYEQYHCHDAISLMGATFCDFLRLNRFVLFVFCLGILLRICFLLLKYVWIGCDVAFLLLTNFCKIYFYVRQMDTFKSNNRILIFCY